MKLLVNVKDNKADFILELLNNFSFVKTETLSPYKRDVLMGLKESVDELNLIRKSKLKGISAKDLLNEL